MRAGERNIYILIAVLVVALGAWRVIEQARNPDPGIPFYTTASAELKRSAEALHRQHGCLDCHTLWLVRDWMQSVPAPALDGIGAIRSEEWLYEYLSAEDPQEILPSRLKAKYQMPSYAHLPEQDRRTIAAYLASLQVEDWFLADVRRMHHEKLTGESYEGNE